MVLVLYLYLLRPRSYLPVFLVALAVRNLAGRRHLP